MLEPSKITTNKWSTKLCRFLFSPLMGKKTGQRIFEFLHLVALKGRNFGMGCTLESSGELYVLRYVKSKIPNPVIFDVGANVGDYAKAASPARIYCFEPSPKIYEILKLKMPYAFLVNAGLSDKPGIAKLFIQNAYTCASSLYKKTFTDFGRPIDDTEEVELTTLDIFCEENHIDRIDLLKLDVEGHELKVLQGATTMLSHIGFIQFEMGKTNLASHTFFKDFYDLLSPDYRLYRLLKNGLDPITSYKETDEVFITTNYLAERKTAAGGTTSDSL